MDALEQGLTYPPILEWLPKYSRGHLVGDGVAGLITAIMLVPQGMAYAMLAGLPPQIGLYASILPLVVYAVFGTSRTMAVGPAAITSLLTASALATFFLPGSDQYIAAAMILAILSGIILILMGVFRIGFLVNFISHPVMAGFINASALIIALSQIKHLFQLDIPRADFIMTLKNILLHLDTVNPVTSTLSLSTIVMLLIIQSKWLKQTLQARNFSTIAQLLVIRSGPLIVVIIATMVASLLSLSSRTGLNIVGTIPEGLPHIALPDLPAHLWISLAPSALLIALVNLLGSMSIAFTLASKRRQKISPNKEFIALGAMNVGAGFSGGLPISGGLSRSIVNFSSGANTPVASLITAALIALSIVFLMPLFKNLPSAVLASIIVVAVFRLVDIKSLVKAWRFNRPDAVSHLLTFAATLVFDIETGILTGVAASIAIYLWRTRKPHMAVVGRVGTTEHFRNINRHGVITSPYILALRIDESLYFANTRYLEDEILRLIAEQPDVRHLVLICSAVNYIDASALESLEELVDRLKDAGVTVHLAEVKGPVMDKLRPTGLLQRPGVGQVYLSTHNAMVALGDTPQDYQI